MIAKSNRAEALVASHPGHAASALHRTNAPRLSQQCRTSIVDGVKVFYREAGPADAPVLLLLDGFPTSSHMFRNLIPLLADEFRVIAPDLPGFGFSDAPERSGFTYSFELYRWICGGART
jgi:alpha-beta hydrolase superfamily lysophospholipase